MLDSVTLSLSLLFFLCSFQGAIGRFEETIRRDPVGICEANAKGHFPGFEPWKLNSSERVTDRTDLGVRSEDLNHRLRSTP